MQLVSSISRPEIAAAERFLHKENFRLLNEFEGVIINLPNVIREAGFHNFFGDNRPRLAISGVDAQRVGFRLDNGLARYGWYSNNLEFPWKWDNTHVLYVGVPKIPNTISKPPVVAGRQQPLILFEVQKSDWTVGERTRQPLQDPAIIQHLIGDLYGVIVTWDLTELEKKALKKINLG